MMCSGLATCRCAKCDSSGEKLDEELKTLQDKIENVVIPSAAAVTATTQDKPEEGVTVDQPEVPVLVKATIPKKVSKMVEIYLRVRLTCAVRNRSQSLNRLCLPRKQRSWPNCRGRKVKSKPSWRGKRANVPLKKQRSWRRRSSMEL